MSSALQSRLASRGQKNMRFTINLSDGGLCMYNMYVKEVPFWLSYFIFFRNRECVYGYVKLGRLTEKL